MDRASLVELVKWLVPFLLSLTVFLRSVADRKKEKRETSSRTRQQYNSELREWAAECVELLSELIQALRGSTEDCAAAIPKLGWRISAKAFQGRFFFPNSHAADHGPGLRPRVLDWLIYAYDVNSLSRTSGDSEAASLIFELERGFALDMQFVLDPANLDSPVEDLQARLQADKDYMESSQRHPVLLKAQAWIEDRQSAPE